METNPGISRKPHFVLLTEYNALTSGQLRFSVLLLRSKDYATHMTSLIHPQLSFEG